MKRIDECHSFSIHVANMVGVKKAILLKEIYGWVHINLAKKKNVKHGLVWTYISASELHEKFFYLPQKSISRWMISLEEDRWIKSGNFNAKGYDSTKWYTINSRRYDDAVISKPHDLSQNEEWLSQIEECLSQNEEGYPQIEEWLYQNEECIPQNGEPIPSPSISEPSPSKKDIEYIKSLEEKNRLLEEENQKLSGKVQPDSSKPKKEDTNKQIKGISPNIPTSWPESVKKTVLEYLGYRQELPKKDQMTSQKSWNAKITFFSNFLKANGEKDTVGAIMVSIANGWKKVSMEWYLKEKPKTNNLVIDAAEDTTTLSEKLEKQFLKARKEFNQKFDGRILYFSRSEFLSWLPNGKNFEFQRRKLVPDQIYKKIINTILTLQTNSFYRHSTGHLADFVKQAFLGKIRELA